MKSLRNLKFIVLIVSILLLAGARHEKKLKIYTVNSGMYLSHHDLARELSLKSTFDIALQKGRFYRENHYSAYGLGLAAVIVDGKLYTSSRPVIRHDGMVLIPYDSAGAIVRSFFPGASLAPEGEYVSVKYDPAESKGLPAENITRNKRDRIRFIVIDPGHGGKDPGAVGKGKIYEKHITLAISRFLRTELKKRFSDLNIIITRNDDRFLELSRRTDIANNYIRRNSNGLFISIHANASLSSKISGYETYFLSQNPTNEEARNTAALENNVIVLEEKSSKKQYGDIDFIEAAMMTTQIQKESSMLARSIQKGMEKRNRSFKSRGVRKADFYVLRGVLMPAVLVEVGFITNSKEKQYLVSSNHQKTIARGIADGVGLFIRDYNKLISIR